MKQRILSRNEKPINYQGIKRIRITAIRTIFIGYDDAGKSVNGRPDDEFSIPKDLSRSAATKLLISGFAKAVDQSAEAEKYIPEPARPKKVKLRVEPPIEMIKIVSAGIRSSEKAFFLGNSNGKGLTGKVGDVFKVGEGEIMNEELARKLISKKFAEKKSVHD